VTQLKQYLPIAVVILIAFFLQAVFIFADCKDTPAKAAVKFTKAYYQVDPAMSELLCKNYLTADNGNVVAQHILKISRDARDRGLGLSYMKNTLYHIKAHTHMTGDATAEVKLTAKRRTSINPIYELIGRFFLIGKTHRVDVTIPMVKEDSRWKVCGSFFTLPEV
jgi:hypothetical protein